MITDERYDLKPDIIQANQYLKSLCKNEVTDLSVTCTSITTFADENDSAIT